MAQLPSADVTIHSLPIRPLPRKPLDAIINGFRQVNIDLTRLCNTGLFVAIAPALSLFSPNRYTPSFNSHYILYLGFHCHGDRQSRSRKLT